MKKIFLSFGVLVAFALYSTFSRHNVGVNADRFLVSNASVFDTLKTSSVPIITELPPPTPTPLPSTPTPIQTPTPTTTTTSAPKPASVPVPTPTPAPTPKPVGQYKDGTYTGSVADAYYGNIQVRAVISGGKISDVIFLQYPNDRGTSVRINTQAMPYLKAEAIQIQGANVNIVSGATDTSRAFRQSMGSALALAKN